MSATKDATSSPRSSTEKGSTTRADDKMDAHHEPAVAISTSQAFLLIFTVTLANMQNVASATVASIALPSIGRDLNIGEDQLQWIVSAYSLSSGCLLIFFGRLADLYGRKRAFMLGTVFSALFGLGCGFAKDSLTINILRGFQGVGAAASIPACLGILAHAFPPSRMRSIAFATFSAGAPVGGAFGMIIGGVLTQLTSPGWRSTFYFTTGLSGLCLLTGLLSIPADPPLTSKNLSSTEVAERRVDWLGAFLVTAGLVFIVFVLSDGETAPNGWKTGYIIALLILGVVLVAAFLYWQTILERYTPLRSEGRPTPRWAAPPLVRPSLWTRAHGKLGAVMAVAFLNWCCFLAWQFWAQLFYQQYLGLTPILTMIRLIPMFVTGITANVIVALVVGRVDVVYLIVTGTLFTGCATLFFALSSPSATYWAYGFPAAIFSVIGADFVFACGTLFVAKVAGKDEQSLAGALFLTMTQLGTSFGLTVSTIVYDRVNKQGGAGEGQGDVKSFRAAQWSAFAFGMLATLITVLFLRGVGIVGHTNPESAPPKDAEQVEDAENEADAPSHDTGVATDVVAAAGEGGSLVPAGGAAETMKQSEEKS